MIDDGDDVGIALDGGFDHRGAVDAGQAQVGDDDVEGELGERAERRFARVGLLDLNPRSVELLGDGLAQRGLVFDEEQMFRLGQAFRRRANILTQSRSGRQLPQIPLGRHLQSPGRCHPIPTSGGELVGGTKNDFDHEGVRARRRQPPHDLQLALERQDRVRPHRRRLGAHLRRHAVARSATTPIARRSQAMWQRRRAEPGLMPVRVSVEELLARGPMDESPELRLLFHRLNNQLGIILAHAELLEGEGDRRHEPRARRAGRRRARSRPWAPPRKFAALAPSRSSDLAVTRSLQTVISRVKSLTTSSADFVNIVDEFHGLRALPIRLVPNRTIADNSMLSQATYTHEI